MKKSYNFKAIKNVEDFLNEIGVIVDIEEDSDEIKFWNFYAEQSESFKDFEELNEYANEKLYDLIDNNTSLDTINQLIEEFTNSSMEDSFN